MKITTAALGLLSIALFLGGIVSLFFSVRTGLLLLIAAVLLFTPLYNFLKSKRIIIIPLPLRVIIAVIMLLFIYTDDTPEYINQADYSVYFELVKAEDDGNGEVRIYATTTQNKKIKESFGRKVCQENNCSAILFVDSSFVDDPFYFMEDPESFRKTSFLVKTPRMHEYYTNPNPLSGKGKYVYYDDFSKFGNKSILSKIALNIYK